jgi:protoheme IX farnesyltransferase
MLRSVKDAMRRAQPCCGARRTDSYPDPVTQSPAVRVSPAAPERVEHESVAPVIRLRAVAPRARSRVASYVALTKPRIIELLLVMRRTTHRPLARHDVSPRGALVFGLVLGVIAVALLGFTTNWLAGGLTAAAIAFYVVVYTMLLKRRTAQNIVWGGAAGCMPVLIGWAAVTGSLAWPALVLFGVIFFWTPPHFWALAIRYRDDYARANVPMLPVVAAPSRVAREIVVYAWLTVATSLALWPLATGWVYGALAVSAGGVLIVGAHRLLVRTRQGANAKAAMQLFHLSNSYLAFVFVAVAVDTFVR